jgi:hypothetical protein
LFTFVIAAFVDEKKKLSDEFVESVSRTVGDRPDVIDAVTSSFLRSRDVRYTGSTEMHVKVSPRDGFGGIIQEGDDLVDFDGECYDPVTGEGILSFHETIFRGVFPPIESAFVLLIDELEASL